jgi:hypothetical protein
MESLYYFLPYIFHWYWRGRAQLAYKPAPYIVGSPQLHKGKTGVRLYGKNYMAWPQLFPHKNQEHRYID